MTTNDRRETPYGVAILRGLQRKTMYEGTVTGDERKARRAKGKLARAARKRQR